MAESAFSVAAHLDPPRARLRLVGELDTTGCPQLQMHLERALAAGCRSFEVDLAGLSFIDAAGLGQLVQARHRLRRDSAAVAYVNPSPVVLRTVVLADLRGLLDGHGGDGPKG